MLKMMTELLILERIAEGDMGMADEVKVSAKASRMGGSQVYLAHNEVFSVEDLLRALAIHSPSYRSVSSILKQGLDRQPLSEEDPEQGQRDRDDRNPVVDRPVDRPPEPVVAETGKAGVPALPERPGARVLQALEAVPQMAWQHQEALDQ